MLSAACQDLLVPVEVPPPGARLFPNIEVVEGGWEDAPPKEKFGVPALNMLVCAGAWLVESDPAPKLNEGVALAPKVNDAEPG